MRKAITLMLCLMMAAALMTGCAANAEQHTGEAQGYGGPLRVTVSMNGTDITAVEVTSHQETEGVGTRAIDVLPDMIVRADSVEVDSVSGATITSEAIKAAVSQAIGAPMMPDSVDMNAVEEESTAAPAMTGVGMAATGRLGPGEDADGNPVYSFNVVFASADFDDAGRVMALDVDQLEVLSSQFTGFPAGGEGEEEFLSQVSQWTTKGAQGDDYMLTSGSWREQMDAYEQMMTGMTIEEINEWFGQNFSTETGKPVDNAEGGAQADATAGEQSDAVTGATMSLRDEHGDILTAIQRAWEDAQRTRTGTPTDMTTDAPDEPAATEDGMINDTNTEPETTGEEETYG